MTSSLIANPMCSRATAVVRLCWALKSGAPLRDCGYAGALCAEVERPCRQRRIRAPQAVPSDATRARRDRCSRMNSCVMPHSRAIACVCSGQGWDVKQGQSNVQAETSPLCSPRPTIAFREDRSWHRLGITQVTGLDNHDAVCRWGSTRKAA